ncbi:hypothetical protein ABIE45_000354 [Methylobacterium sp. OAE515]|uniref:DUF1376 domain-containing protein n=1 Tax=Methylobacterium sp. OAE515 TaxID=2817895 RepID=UPI001789FD69
MKGEFYKMDFEAWDTGTVDLPLEVEAAYLRLCHQMYRVGGPIPNSVKLLQGLFRCGHIKAVALLRKLVEAGKIQVTEDGLLANYRVGKELLNRESLASKRRVAGELGGTNSGVSRAKSLMQNDADEAIASGLRTRGEERRGDTPIVPKGTEPEGFAEFREAYPKRSTAFPTTQARKRWLEARRRGVTPAEIIAGTRAYAAEQARIGKTGTEFVQSADVWLNRQRWQDYAAPLPTSQPGKPTEDAYLASLSDERWRLEVRTWRARHGHWPLRIKTPPPDDPATKVPLRILAEFGLQHGSSIAELKLTGTG